MSRPEPYWPAHQVGGRKDGRYHHQPDSGRETHRRARVSAASRGSGSTFLADPEEAVGAGRLLEGNAQRKRHQQARLHRQAAESQDQRPQNRRGHQGQTRFNCVTRDRPRDREGKGQGRAGAEPLPKCAADKAEAPIFPGRAASGDREPRTAASERTRKNQEARSEVPCAQTQSR